MDKYELGRKLSGPADVTVTGPFQSGDMVYLGTKALTVAGGVASGSMGIKGLRQSKGLKVIYVPGGVDDLKPSKFVAVGMLDFDDGMNASPRSGPRATGGVSVGEIVYDGYTSQGYAYGVIGGNATSVSESDAIAAVLNGGWSAGKGSCSLVSNATLEVQHMVRTGRGHFFCLAESDPPLTSNRAFRWNGWRPVRWANCAPDPDQLPAVTAL